MDRFNTGEDHASNWYNEWCEGVYDALPNRKDFETPEFQNLIDDMLQPLYDGSLDESQASKAIVAAWDANSKLRQELLKEKELVASFRRTLDHALNSGDGVYRP